MIESFIQFKPKSEWREMADKRQDKTRIRPVNHIPGITNAWVMPTKTRIDYVGNRHLKRLWVIKVCWLIKRSIQDSVCKLEENLENPVEGTASFIPETRGRRVVCQHWYDRAKASRYGMNIQDGFKSWSRSAGGWHECHQYHWKGWTLSRLTCVKSAGISRFPEQV